MIYDWEKELKKELKYNNNLKNDDLMSLFQRTHFLQDVFQMTTIALVSVINHYHINGLHYFETPSNCNYLILLTYVYKSYKYNIYL